MKFRQINLDFHTSEKIPEIGKKFNKEHFQKCLKLGHVNSVTLFSKCHHGWAYHPSTANEMHPNLEFDLLGAEIEAAREIGVETVLYFSLGTDEKYARKNPKHIYNIFGEGQKPLEKVGWHSLCTNTKYLDYFCNQVYETLSKYPADGVFVDILSVIPCVCEECKKEMYERGLDPENINDVWEMAKIVYLNTQRRIRETVDKVNPKLELFFNGGHLCVGRRELSALNSHLEIESLPTGGWGYDNFPMAASYARVLGKEYLGMTAKFHLHWGEFGGYKHPNALRYEVSLFAANCAKFSIGDQMPPSGKLDEETYRIIGRAYSEAEEKEPWLEDAENIVEIGVLGAEFVMNYYEKGEPVCKSFTDSGCVRILNEGHYLYNFIDSEEDFAKYKLIILADKVVLDNCLTEKLKVAAAKGTKILATGLSGTKDGKFVFDLGCEFVGKNELNPSYVRPNCELKTYKDASFVIYSNGYLTKNTYGEELAAVENLYFNRTPEHFCSHLHAPSTGEKVCSGITLGKDGAYIAWDIFNEYSENGSLIAKELVCATIDSLIDKKIKTNLPQQGIVTLAKQHNREIIHLLYAAAVRRGGVEVIEDIIPIHNTTVSVKTDILPKRVYLAPQYKNIDFVYENGEISFTVPEFECHQMVVMEVGND